MFSLTFDFGRIPFTQRSRTQETGFLSDSVYENSFLFDVIGSNSENL